MKQVFRIVSSSGIFIAFLGLISNSIVAASGGGSDYIIHVNLLRIIATGVVGIGFLKMSKIEWV